MKIITPSKIRYGNYLFPLRVQSHSNNLEALLVIFSKHKYSPVSVCAVPSYWAGPIKSYIRKIIDIDPKIEIGYIKEKNGRLSIRTFTGTKDTEKLASINALIYSLKNAIDYAVSNRINMCKRVEDIDKKWLAIPENINATSAGTTLLC